MALSYLPESFVPYAELIRITKPAGVAAFYFPCLYGTFLAGVLNNHHDIFELLSANLQLFVLSFLQRGALCTWNDILDQDFDRQVTRTKTRPLPRGAISTANASVFLALQTIVVGFWFSHLPHKCFWYSLPFLVLHVMYPLAKRWTHHPQIVLGLAFTQGVFISFPVLGETLPIGFEFDFSLVSALSLGLAVVFWTLLYDTIYAAQDLTDDKVAGVGSTMVYWEKHARNFLRLLAVLTVACLFVVSFPLTRLSPMCGAAYTALTCVGTAMSLTTMVEMVDLNDPKDCGWWFSKGNVLIGLMIASGLIGAYIV